MLCLLVLVLPVVPIARPDPTCVCDPLCEDPVASDESCASVARSDCPCCVVCAVQTENDPCHPVTQPCDVAKKLHCDQEENVCKGSMK